MHVHVATHNQWFIQSPSRGGCKHGNPNFWGGETNTKYMTEPMILEGKHGLEVGKFHSPTPCMNSDDVVEWVCITWLIGVVSEFKNGIPYKNCWAFAQLFLKLNQMIWKVAQAVDIHCCEKKEGENAILVPLGSVCKRPFLCISIHYLGVKSLIEHNGQG